MSKIVTAINVMISNPTLITNVVSGSNDIECFFTYDGKHSWSILSNSQGYYLAYYPGKQNIEEISKISDQDWDSANVHHIVYTSQELGTKEAKESMAELFRIVNEKKYGMADVLDEIIATDKSL